MPGGPCHSHVLIRPNSELKLRSCVTLSIVGGTPLGARLSMDDIASQMQRSAALRKKIIAANERRVLPLRLLGRVSLTSWCLASASASA